MFNVNSVIARLKAQMPELGSVEGAEELAAMLKSGSQVWAKPKAHVALLGLRGGAVQDFAGAFVQGIDHSFGVYLSLAAHGDAKGNRAGTDVPALVQKVVTTLCGWVPPDQATDGEVRLMRAYLAELKPGVLIYAIEFSLSDQVRIPS